MRALKHLVLSLGLGFVASLISLAGTAHALEAREWTVESLRGEVRVQTEGPQPIALTPNVRLGAGSTIETGDDGRVVLVRGDETIIVSPKTLLALPEDNSSGLATTILQSFGTILLQVEKRAEQHFEVETPFLAAVVKGTKFTVTVEAAGAAVHVVEGAVQVIDLDTGDMGLVRPGQTAHSAAAQGAGLSIAGPGAVQPSRAAVEPRANAVPAAPTPDFKAAGDASSPAQPAVQTVLSEPVGALTLDVAASTNGLVRAASVSPGSVVSMLEPLASDAKGNPSVAAALGPVGQVNTVAMGLLNSGGGGANGVGLVGGGNAGGGRGLALGQSVVVASGSAVGSVVNNNVISGSIGDAAGLADGLLPGLVGNSNSNANANANANGLAGILPPGLVNNGIVNIGGL